MIGFESYVPRSWLAEKVLAIHVSTTPKPARRPAYRRGTWASVAISAGIALASVFTSFALDVPTSVTSRSDSTETAQAVTSDASARPAMSDAVVSGVARARMRAEIAEDSATMAAKHVDELLARFDHSLAHLLDSSSSGAIDADLERLANDALNAINIHGDRASSSVWVKRFLA